MRLASTIAAALLLACAGPRPAPTGSGEPDAPEAAALEPAVEALRARLKARLAAQAAVYWNSWTTGEELAAAGGPDELSSADALARIDALRRSVRDPAKVRALAMLRGYVAAELAARDAAPASEALAVAIARATVSADGETFSLREVEMALAGESHAGRRRALAQAALPIIRSLLPLAAERDSQLDAAVRRLGYPDARTFVAELRGIDLPAMARLADALLAATELTWRDGLALLARRRLEMRASELQRADLARAFRTGDLDAAFPRASMEANSRALLSSIGLLPDKLPALRIDADARPGRRPRALALPVSLPGEVRLSLRPMDGLIAHSQAMHELGHAVQYALVREPQFEFANLGTEPQGEALAYLFEGLAEEPEYAVSIGVPAERRELHVRLGGLRRLLAARLEAGRVLCDAARLPGAARSHEACRAAMSRAYGVPLEEEDALRHLAEGEALLASAERLRGMVLAAQLEAHLVASFGERWWADARVGARLAQLLGSGSRTRLESWLAQIGASGLDAAPLVARLQRAATWKAPRVSGP